MWTLLIVLISLYLFMRISARWLFPWLLKMYLKRMQQRMETAAGYNQTGRQSRATHSNAKNPPDEVKSRIDTSDIEEVDYEEIK